MCVYLCVLAFRDYQTSEPVMARRMEDQAKGLEPRRPGVSSGGKKKKKKGSKHVECFVSLIVLNV